MESKSLFSQPAKRAYKKNRTQPKNKKPTLEQKISTWARMLDNDMGDEAMQEIRDNYENVSTRNQIISKVRMYWLITYAQRTDEFLEKLGELYTEYEFDRKAQDFLLNIENMPNRDLEVIYGKSKAGAQDLINEYGIKLISQIAKLPLPWPDKFYEFKADEEDQRLARQKILKTNEVSQSNAPRLDGPIGQQIYDKICRDGIESKDPFDVTWALLLASGRRISEILALGVFSESNHGSYWVHVLRTVKLRGSADLYDDFHAPLLIPYSLWSQKLQEVRSWVESKFGVGQESSPAMVSRKTSVAFNRQWQAFLQRTGLDIKLFGTKIRKIDNQEVESERFTIHKLRAIYLSFVLRTFDIGSTSLIKFSRDILGHESQGAFMSYLLANSRGPPLKLVQYGPISMPSQYPQPILQSQDSTFNLQAYKGVDGIVRILVDNPIEFKDAIIAPNYELTESK